MTIRFNVSVIRYLIVRYSIVSIIVFDFSQSIANKRLYRRDESTIRMIREECLFKSSICSNNDARESTTGSSRLSCYPLNRYCDYYVPRSCSNWASADETREVQRNPQEKSVDILCTFLFYIRDPYTWALNILSHHYAFLLRMSSRLKLCW